MNESIAEAADVLMSLVERTERARFDLARVTADDGVALAFYCRVDATSADEATAYAVVLDEESPSQWEALGASELQPGGSRVASVRPSERGDWIVAIYGSAPVDARVAVMAYEDVERRLPVEAGFYAFMTRVATEPEPTTTRPRFE
jgi:hypothetical protein